MFRPARTNPENGPISNKFGCTQLKPCVRNVEDGDIPGGQLPLNHSFYTVVDIINIIWVMSPKYVG